MVSEFLADFIAGWVGGVFCVVTGFPFDTVKVRQQTFSTTFKIAVRETFKYEGILGFYRGMASPLIAYGPSNSIYFGVFGLAMRLLGENDKHSSKKQKGTRYFFHLFCAGSIGGFFQAAVMCPVELVKIVLQTSTDGKSAWVHNSNLIQFRGAMDAYRTIIRLQGFRGLYKGFVPMIFRDVPTSGIYFVVYEALLPKDRSQVVWYHKIWGGGWAGIAAISTVLPIDLVKTRIQADDLLYPRYKGMLDCIKHIYTEEGRRTFWKGLPVITARAFPANAMLFVGYEMTMDMLGK